ncbi:MAG TPA: helix-turn-helix domain-containing protein [Caulobacteraceae bacterium]|nr:helix-turn-helix domain-containing protein [Caulobacteraceae bacterium]
MIPERLRYDLTHCSIGRALEALGEKWSLLIVREAFYGLRRFDDFAAALGCGRAVLSQRLKRLTAEGVFEAARYRRPGQRARLEYRLTPKGQALLPTILALSQWADAWAPGPDGPVLMPAHAGCGETVSVTLSCGRHDALAPGEVALLPGPGAKRLGT